jgi:biofilm PGA synthesis N-glycosyltransferase PgaC
MEMDRSQSKRDISPLTCSVGIMAYNEAANIASAIETILGQRLTTARIAELIVVASGCTDETVPIVTRIARDDARVRLIVQERREGKASAINLFLGAARSPLLLMVSADVIIKDGTLAVLLHHFQDPTVGMVGAHPIPVNNEETFLGYAVHLLWQLHDRVARAAPKLGEVVAFRNVIPSIPLDTPVDEISIQALITQLGYRLVYEPQAIVYNRGPATLSDFLRQRRRIYAGHLRIRQQQGYTASTMNPWRVGRTLLAANPFTTPRTTWWTIGTVGLEALARGMGRYDYLRRRPQHVWQVAATTKSYIADEAYAQLHQSVLVFHIAGFHQQELELGTRNSSLLVQQIAQRMRQSLGPNSLVSTERSGTIIALLPVEREEAERTAQQLIATIEATPVRLNGHHEGVSVKLACGIIAFLQTGHALALSIPATI